MYNNGIKYSYESETKETKTTNFEHGEMMSNQGIMCPPIYECPEERVIHREFVHEVPHIKPINTRIVNHHIYRHTYSPCYTCCEENEVCNVTDGCPMNY